MYYYFIFQLLKELKDKQKNKKGKKHNNEDDEEWVPDDSFEWNRSSKTDNPEVINDSKPTNDENKKELENTNNDLNIDTNNTENLGSSKTFSPEVLYYYYLATCWYRFNQTTQKSIKTSFKRK